MLQEDEGWGYAELRLPRDGKRGWVPLHVPALAAARTFLFPFSYGLNDYTSPRSRQSSSLALGEIHKTFPTLESKHLMESRLVEEIRSQISVKSGKH